MNQLSKTCSKPSKPYLATEKKVIRYLKGYKNGVPHKEGCSDTPFVSKSGTRRSTIIYHLFIMGGGLVSLGSVTQTLTAQSTVDAELIALSSGAQQSINLSNLLSEL